MVMIKAEPLEMEKDDGDNAGDNIENMLVIDEDYDTDSETLQASLAPPMKADESLEREIMKEMIEIAQDISEMDQSVLGEKHGLTSKQLLSNEMLSQMSVEEAMEAIHMESEDSTGVPPQENPTENDNTKVQEKEDTTGDKLAGPETLPVEDHQESLSSNIPDLISSNTSQILHETRGGEDVAQANNLVDNTETQSKVDSFAIGDSHIRDILDNTMIDDSLVCHDNNVDCGHSENGPVEEDGGTQEEDPLKIDETASFLGQNSLKEAIEKSIECPSNKTSKLCEEILKNTDSAIESIRENFEKKKTDLEEKNVPEEKSFLCKNKSETKLVILTSTLKQRLEADKASKTSNENKTDKEIDQARPEEKKKDRLQLHLVKSKHGNFSVGKPKNIRREKFQLSKTIEK